MTAIPPAAAAISGPIGAGKTTTARLLSQRTGWPYAAFGDVVRAAAIIRGLPDDRGTLQQLGLELIAAGWETFVRSVFDQVDWHPGRAVIIDGVRHLAAVNVLRLATAPLPVVVIYLDISSANGLTRASCRDQMRPEASQLAAGHPIEHDLPEVRDVADLIVPVTGCSPSTVTDHVLGYLATRVRPSGDRGG